MMWIREPPEGLAMVLIDIAPNRNRWWQTEPARIPVLDSIEGLRRPMRRWCRAHPDQVAAVLIRRTEDPGGTDTLGQHGGGCFLAVRSWQAQVSFARNRQQTWGLWRPRRQASTRTSLPSSAAPAVNPKLMVRSIPAVRGRLVLVGCAPVAH